MFAFCELFMWWYLRAGGPYKYMKTKINELDVDKYYAKYTNFEGDVLDNVLECVVYESSIESTGSGSHYKLVGHFHTKGDVVYTLEDAKMGLQSMQVSYKAVEEYLSNNPEIYAWNVISNWMCDLSRIVGLAIWDKCWFCKVIFLTSVCFLFE